MEGIILCGGLGTRLREMVYDVPKAMAPINDKPFLEYLLNYLNGKGFKNIILAVGYKHHVIVDYFGDHFKNINIKYAIEEQPLGTGGAIISALKLVEEDQVFVLNGDTLFDIDFDLFTMTENITIASKYVDNSRRYGLLEIKDGYIESFLEKGSNSNGYINGGIYKLSKSFFSNLNFPKKFSFENDFLEKYVIKNKIKTEIFDGYFIDIGIPTDYKKFIKDTKNEKSGFFG